MTTVQTAAAEGLQRGAIGLREVLFQSITAMAPGAAIAASVPGGAAFAGGALPLSVVVALVACLFTALSIGELARHLPSSGSVATYTAQGLHPGVGFLVGWGYVFVELLVPPLLFLQLGFTVAGTLHDESSGFSAGLWWVFALIGAVIVLLAGYRGITASAKLGTILGAFEIAVFLVLGVLFVIKAGSHNTLSVFGTSHTPDGHKGVSGVIAGSVYTVLAFSGFEAAAPLAEEAKDPKRTIRRAVVGATLLIGALYVFTTYAVDVAFGPDRFATFTTTGHDSWQGLARASYGLFWVLVFLAIVNSTIANANAGASVSTRTAYALGRIRLLPRMVTVLHPTHRSPYLAVYAQFVIGVVVTLGLGFAYDPVTAFYLVATVIVIVVVLVYILCNLACIGFFLRKRREDFSPLLHLVLPALGVVAFVPALFTAAGIKSFSFVTPLKHPVSYAGPVVLVWLLIGLVYLVYLFLRHPDRVRQMSQVHLVDELDAHEKEVAA
ncbi:MAG: amino acid permease [Frankiales bacterium]|nr:amino acid permease [Frankiales bacterium]